MCSASWCIFSPHQHDIMHALAFWMEPGAFYHFLVFSLAFLKFVVYIATTGIIHISTHCSLYASTVKTAINLVFCMEKKQTALILILRSHLLSSLKPVLFLPV